jgi:hypothetical protein
MHYAYVLFLSFELQELQECFTGCHDISLGSMSSIVRDMEPISDTSWLRQTRGDKREWDLVVSSDSIRLIGYRLGIDDIIPQLLIELLSTSQSEYTREEGDICSYILSDNNWLLSSTEVCLQESIPIITELLI